MWWPISVAQVLRFIIAYLCLFIFQYIFGSLCVASCSCDFPVFEAKMIWYALFSLLGDHGALFRNQLDRSAYNHVSENFCFSDFKLVVFELYPRSSFSIIHAGSVVVDAAFFVSCVVNGGIDWLVSCSYWRDCVMELIQCPWCMWLVCYLPWCL